jgi:hypothetical protein
MLDLRLLELARRNGRELALEIAGEIEEREKLLRQHVFTPRLNGKN